ncbi:MAG: hypothetical protein ACM31C_03790 [Acidobacteriota bacterium]
MTRIGLVLAVLAACTVSRKTDSLACTTSNDCNNGRTCIEGYCVTSAAGSCPTPCTSCTGTQCNILVTSGGQDITCPAGFSCAINCSGDAACGDIVCGPDQCSITCQGTAACGAINCASSCGCQVNCASGDCGANSCPTGRMGAACVNGSGLCSTSPVGCNGC